jgi:RNA polymerase sigma factor (sigma-70 family)
VCSYILKNSGTVDEAKDVYQETIIAFYENVRDKKFKGESAISTYLYAIAKFKWLNQLKKKGIMVAHHEKLKPEDSFYKSPLANIIDKEQKELVVEVLAQLGNSCKNLLIESIYHNKSMKKIVEEGNFSSEQIARNKKYKCLKRLKELLIEKPQLVKILRAYE